MLDLSILHQLRSNGMMLLFRIEEVAVRRIITMLLILCAAAAAQEDVRIVNALRTIRAAQVAYESEHNRFACSLQQLGRHDGNTQIGLINADLVSGKYEGYEIQLKCIPHDYRVVASPIRSNGPVYCLDKSAVVRSGATPIACFKAELAPKHER